MAKKPLQDGEAQLGLKFLQAQPTLDENINSWINGFGDKKIEKFHLSQSTASNGDVTQEIGKNMLVKAMVQPSFRQVTQ